MEIEIQEVNRRASDFEAEFNGQSSERDLGGQSIAENFVNETTPVADLRGEGLLDLKILFSS